ncbi:hypothetical protein SH668x_003577 [Planctomicrobium sp. SH668]|uniref:hypothetical protein n=1 Tax=Planctomicrobium sp. SH668 TaxID=3448126 RepID=UPI003F5B62AF
MRVGNLQSAAGRIQDALEELQIAWQNTREHWNDQQAIQFEQTVLKPLAEQLVITIPAINKISQTFGAAERECSE